MSKYIDIDKDIDEFKKSKGLKSLLPSVSIIGKSAINVGIFAASNVIVPLLNESIKNTSNSAKNILKDPNASEEKKAKAKEFLETKEKEMRTSAKELEEKVNKKRS